MKKCIILVDGSNFYFKLKDLKFQNLLNFNFTDFNKFLSGKHEVVKSIYHIGRIKTDGSPKTQKMFNSQRKLFYHLKTHDYLYSLGYLMKNDGKYHEKGVDVNMAVDILVTAYENIADKIILISSDTDLLPAIKKAQQKGKTVEYIGFSHKPSLAMVAVCDLSRLLTEAEISRFLTQKNPAKA